ncbi:hypothetical protein PIB30_108958, partial [Stylosanthes scabra]|nr:hypothetical protein [Stylosanthes scabra]
EVSHIFLQLPPSITLGHVTSWVLHVDLWLRNCGGDDFCLGYHFYWAKNVEMTHVMANMSLDCQSADIYTNWALQQMNQNLVPIPPARIPRMIRENFQASRPLVHGILRTRRSEGSSSGLDQQTPPAANTPRGPSADNN